jgi:thiol-disulfide isomerase/thioredoxin
MVANNPRSLLKLLILPLIIGIIYLGRHLYLKPKYHAGDQLHDFSTTLLDGRPFRLSSLKGKYVLVDFWASWCSPCRADNPNLVKLYEDSRSKQNIEIVSIALERSEAPWRNAIQKDGLSWPYHIGEFEQFSGPLATKFGVREIPTKYLLNPEGKVLAVNPDMPTIYKIIGL